MMNDELPENPSSYERAVRRLFNQQGVTAPDIETVITWLVAIYGDHLLMALGPLHDVTKYEEFVTTPGIINTQLKAYEANLIDAYARFNEHLLIKHRAGLMTSAPNPTHYRSTNQ